ncbi:hypothetical protein [Halorarius halobius]|uniref:hypothetical protein n=1 Tax=Halorarius halobius TaxID=2962671 RepID=UPI0020CDFDD4|nr:hypothetical protein [Halorarius halobius]
MADLITEYANYDAFVREWHSETLTDDDGSLEEARNRGLLNERNSRQLWQLLGLLDPDELLIQLPEWLADEKGGSMNRTTAIMFVGTITRETDDAILFENSAAAQPLMQLAHKIHSLERGIENIGADTDHHERLAKQLEDYHQQICNREGLPSLSDEWLPKSQLIAAVRRRE